MVEFAPIVVLLKMENRYDNDYQYLLKLNNAKLSSFPGGSDGKTSACNAGDVGSIPVLGRSPGEGNGNPLQYPCLENPMDGGA